MRFCIPTTINIEVETKPASDGRLIYKLGGEASSTYREFIGLLDRLFYNRSYHFTSDTDECLARVQSNLSDVDASYHSYYKNLTNYTVPVPVIMSKTSIIAGFDINSTRSSDSAGLQGIFELLELPVYLWSLFLLALLILIIASRVLLHFHLEWTQIRHSPGSINRLILQRGRQRIADASYLMTKISHQVSRTFRGSSRISRWAGFLFTLLYFFVITSFLSVYSTSKVIVEEPFTVKNYQQLLDEKSSVPLFYDLVSKVSDQFQGAPSGSIKHKVWLKLLKNKANASDYIFNGENARNPREVMLKVVGMVQKDKSVFITSSFTSHMLKTFGCGSSPDGSSEGVEQFWRLVINSDPLEHEDIFGWALTDRIKSDRMFTQKVNRLYHSGILIEFFEKQTDATRFASFLAGTSKHHLHQARHFCSDDYKIDTEQDFQVVTLHYYRVFMFVFSVVFILSTVSLALEKARKNRSMMRRSRVSRINRPQK